MVTLLLITFEFFSGSKEEKSSQLKWAWKQIPLFEGEWGQEQGHVLWAINCLFCCPALILCQRWQVSWGKSFFQICGGNYWWHFCCYRPGHFLEKLLTVSNSVWRVHFQITSLISSTSVTGCNRRLPFRMEQEVAFPVGFKCWLGSWENNIYCAYGWAKVAMTLC